MASISHHFLSIAGTPIKPPQLDEFFCANEAELRENDFHELGFSEQEIWGVSTDTDSKMQFT
ncbi:MAG: hypothetical protein KME30_14615 [Iphinoe sp. HA4291-MV1]|jgi:hypothetical protein|nr:hypothetical protein [Iphinoe sp. HA4291-MV1]